jgi:hypothetical protein
LNGICRAGVVGDARTASPRHRRIASNPLGLTYFEALNADEPG